MENFQIIVASIALISIVILFLIFKNLDSKKIKDDASKDKPNNPLGIFILTLFIIVTIGLFLTNLTICSEGSSSHDIFIEDPIRRP